MTRLAAYALIAALATTAACYRPETPESAFRCSPDLGGLCPGGMICSTAGLCITPGSVDMGKAPLDLAGDQASGPFERTCDDRVRQGAFTGLVALSAVNTTSDEAHLAYDATSGGHRLVFVRNGQLFSAPIASNDGKAVSAPVAVALSGAPPGLQLRGGSFGSDGKYWFAGTVGGTTSLYAATRVDATTFTVAAAQAPVATSCAFSDPFLTQGDVELELYIGYPLAGCAGPRYVATGAVSRNIAAFYSSLPESGWAAPSMTTSGLLLLTSSTLDHHLYAAERSGLEFQFANANRIPMTAIGEATEDRQAVVSADCTTIYFSSVRPGSVGGADLYAATIAAE